MQKVFLVFFLFVGFQSSAQEAVLASDSDEVVQTSTDDSYLIPADQIALYSGADFQARLDTLLVIAMTSGRILKSGGKIHHVVYIDSLAGMYSFDLWEIVIKGFTWYQEAITGNIYQIFTGMDLGLKNNYAIQTWELFLPRKLSPRQVETYYRFYSRSQKLVDNPPPPNQ